MANDQKSLESWIWDAASSIRGAKDAAKYKEFILPLVFTKRLCDVFDDELNRIAKEVGSRAKAFKLVARDPKLVRFFLPIEPKDADAEVWSVIRGLSDRIGEQLTTHLRSIANANPLLKGIIDRIDFNATTHGVRDLDDNRLSNLIEAISAKSLGLDDVEPDIIGRSYEYLIRKFAEGSGQSAGEFYTPREVGLVMARLMDLEPGMTVYDPCCGSAGLLINCQLTLAEQLRATHVAKKTKPAPLTLYGQEYVGTTWAMANMNMIIHDMQGKIEIGDSFKDPKFRAGKRLQTFDRVVANPMWNQDWFKEADYDSDELGRFPYGAPPDSTADWGWVQHMLSSVGPTGKVAVVLDTAAVSRGSGSKNKSREKEIRQKVVEDGLVEAVILLPENLFYNTGAPGIIVLLNRARSPNDPIRLVNASKLFTKGNPKNFLAEEHVERIVEAARSSSDIDDLCRVVSPDVVAEIDFDLSPARHVPLDPEVPVVELAEGTKLADAAYKAATVAHQTTQNTLATFHAVTMGSGSALPSGWQRASLESLISRKISGDWGDDRPSETKSCKRCAVIRGTDFPDVARLRFADVPTRFITDDVLKKKQPVEGDILVEVSGGGKYQNTGRAIYLTAATFETANDPVMFTNFTKLLRVSAAKILPRYFFYAWSLLYDLGRTARYEKQPTNIKNFKIDDFLKHEMIVFPVDLGVQAEIVAALEAVHAELDALDAARHQMLAVRHAALKELLSGAKQPRARATAARRAEVLAR